MLQFWVCTTRFCALFQVIALTLKNNCKNTLLAYLIDTYAMKNDVVIYSFSGNDRIKHLGDIK